MMGCRSTTAKLSREHEQGEETDAEEGEEVSRKAD